MAEIVRYAVGEKEETLNEVLSLYNCSLDMLHEKTKGNLDKNEGDLLQGILYELKMRYVKEKV